MKNSKPKILIFSLTYFPFIGGAEVAVQEITKRLAGNFTFDLITARLDKKLPVLEVIENVNVHRVGWGSVFDKYLYPWLALKKGKELCHSTLDVESNKEKVWIPAFAGMTTKKCPYCIIWGVLEFWGGWAALKFKEKFPQAKYLLTMQSGDSDAFVKIRTWFWFKRYCQIFTKADRIQVISQWLESRARSYGYQGIIDLVPNGVNVTESKKTASEIKRILTVSRLVEKNGLEDLIKGFKLLFTDYGFKSEQVVLKIIGAGPLKHKLEKLVKELELDTNIFLGERSYKQIQEEYYVQADVFVRPSLSEGLGNVFLEAMAHGLPVIATPVGGIPDFLHDGETGWFCQVRNPASIAKKIAYLLDEKNAPEVAEVVARARKMVAERYSWEMVAQKMKEIFEKLQN